MWYLTVQKCLVSGGVLHFRAVVLKFYHVATTTTTNINSNNNKNNNQHHHYLHHHHHMAEIPKIPNNTNSLL